MKPSTAIGALLLALTALLVAGPQGGVQAATENVDVIDDAYDPDPVTIDVGDTVDWDFSGASNAHSVTFDDISVDSGVQDPNEGGFDPSFSHTFDTAGTFTYYCIIHGAGTMSGTVNVQGAADNTPTATTTAGASATPTRTGTTTPATSVTPTATGTPADPPVPTLYVAPIAAPPEATGGAAPATTTLPTAGSGPSDESATPRWLIAAMAFVGAGCIAAGMRTRRVR